MIIGPPLFNGMAGSKRILNLARQLKSTEEWRIYSYSAKYLATKSNDGIYQSNSYLSFLKNLLKSSPNEKYLYHYGYINIYTLLAVLTAKLRKISVLLDIVEDLHIDHGKRDLKYKLKYKIANKFYRLSPYLANGIIVISNHLYEKITEDFENLKVKLIPISIDKENFSFDSQTDQKNSKIKLFYGGSFAAKDGIENVLDAFKILRKDKYECELILTGKINKSRKQYVLNMIKSHPYHSDIKYLGFLSDSEYYEVLNLCDIHLMIRNTTEFANAGFPFKLGEMLATGKPVVVSRLIELETIMINKKNCLIISPDNTEEISDSIKYLINNNEMANEIGNAGRITSFNLFDSSIIKNKFLEFINEIQ